MNISNLDCWLTLLNWRDTLRETQNDLEVRVVSCKYLLRIHITTTTGFDALEFNMNQLMHWINLNMLSCIKLFMLFRMSDFKSKAMFSIRWHENINMMLSSRRKISISIKKKFSQNENRRRRFCTVRNVVKHCASNSYNCSTACYFTLQ